MNQEVSACSPTGCLFTCPITGFKFSFKPRFMIAALATIVWANLFAWLWHGVVLSETYQETSSLWRGPDQMLQGPLNAGLALSAFIATIIFIRGYEGNGWKEGLRFGILISLLFLGVGLVTFATQPIPFYLIGMWVLGDFITYTVAGIFLSLFLGKCSAPS